MLKQKLIYLMGAAIGLLIVGSCNQSPTEFGILEGHVSIGPLVPVLREGELPPTPSPEVYSSREIVVYDEDGKTEFIRLEIDATGNYRGELPVGIYFVDINRLGIDSAADLPMEIEITSGDRFQLDIDIDTGIR